MNRGILKKFPSFGGVDKIFSKENLNGVVIKYSKEKSNNLKSYFTKIFQASSISLSNNNF